jgi:hypothetical protein
MIDWLLLFAPCAVGLEHVAPWRHCLRLAERMGEGVQRSRRKCPD